MVYYFQNKCISQFLVFIGFLCVSNLNAQFSDKQLQKLQLSYQLINSLYVDSVDQNQLVEEGIVSMLKSLDPHSAYISSNEVAQMNEPLDGSFEGVGVQFNIMNDTLLVVASIIGGPSEKVGIMAGDRIVKIDGDNVAGVGLKNSDVFKYLRGKKGTKVKVDVLRRGVTALLEFTVTRDKIPIHSVESAYMVSPSTGYVKITRFAMNTHDEFIEALETLKCENLILDLRGNGGGYLKAATDIADEFVSGNKILVYTEGLNSARRDHYARKKGVFEKGNLVVLMDEGSASASEIVAGAIQDWDRGVIIGRRSFGKGLVQRPFDFPDGSMIRLTIAKYYTPSGRCIQKDYDKGYGNYQHEIEDRFRNGEMVESDSIEFDVDLKFETRIKGRVVYGGGGIMPDLFVPIDTTMFSNYYRNLLASGSVNRSVLSYVDSERNSLLKKYPNYGVFENDFKVTDAFLALLIQEGEDAGVKRDDEGLTVSKVLIKSQMKALVARDLFSSSEYFQSINGISEAYNKAIEVLDDKKEYSKLLK